MEHFANFGAIRTANRQLKKAEQMRVGNENYKTRNGSDIPFSDGIADNPLKIARSNIGFGGFDNPDFRGRQLSTVWANDDFTNKIIAGQDRRRQRKIKNWTSAQDTTLYRKPQSGKESVIRRRSIEVPNLQDFTDIRKTTDQAASKSGYLGFRKDPYKGYGGMMEEAIDTSIKKEPKARIPY